MRVSAVERARLAALRRGNLALHDVTRTRWGVAKAYGRLRAQVKLHQRPSPILVYQMGKVASETVARSLRADDELAARGVAHVHFFDEGTLRSEEEALRAQRRRDVRAGRHIWESR